MKETLKYVCMAVFTCLTIATFAQSDVTLYNMNFVHTRLNLNPALRPQAKFNLAIPGLGSTMIGFTNSGFAVKDLIYKRPQDDSLVIDMEKMLGKLKPTNFMSIGLKMQLFDLGFKLGAGYIRLMAQERFETRYSYTKDLMNFLIKGNGPTAGTEQKLNIGLDLMHFREYGLGYSHEINEQLTLGITFKYLYGMENIQTASSDVIIFTDPNTYAITARSNIKVNTSGLDSAIGDARNNVSKYLTGKKNTGFAADFGITYKPHKRWMISASLLDLGSIKWKDDLYTYTTRNPNQPYTFYGININDFLNDSSTLGDAFSKAGDSLQNTLQIDNAKSRTAYKTKLTRQFYIGANYFVGEKTSVGALFNGTFYNGKMYPTIGVNASTGVGRFMNLSATYSITNGSYANLGLGAAINMGPLQWHVMTDNLFAITKPLESRNVQVRTGFYLTFGRKAADRDEDGITDFKDKCPDEPGLKIYDGCPDSDGDGIINMLDSCPQAAGPEFWNGCPDTDNDSIIDRFDECPSDSGLKQFNGCPDTDGDGIPNKLDSCPYEAGLIQFNGCADRDGDGVMDKLDQCPDSAGLPQFKGCPDKDGDGVEDRMDQCPAEAGLIQFNGCPDKDGDGVYDKIDMCPDSAGLPQFNGCPDTDGDGTHDKMDACPKVAGPLYTMGCPDIDGDSTADALDLCPQTPGPRSANGCPDTDGDGLSDNYDKCPTVPGVPANNGCPELKKEEQEILNAAFENLEFAVGKDVIQATSMKSLADLATLLKKNPTWKLQIDGHTDNVGNAAKNKLLSQKRADAVKRYLTSKGVAASRLSGKGWGSTKPIADNTTSEGRDRNRRVEMTIIQ
jgi:outer membrane protein OmpA-like peptidoglycan-associated protein